MNPGMLRDRLAAARGDLLQIETMLFTPPAELDLPEEWLVAVRHEVAESLTNVDNALEKLDKGVL